MSAKSLWTGLDNCSILVCRPPNDLNLVRMTKWGLSDRKCVKAVLKERTEVLCASLLRVALQ